MRGSLYLNGMTVNEVTHHPVDDSVHIEFQRPRLDVVISVPQLREIIAGVRADGVEIG